MVVNFRKLGAYQNYKINFKSKNEENNKETNPVKTENQSLNTKNRAAKTAAVAAGVALAAFSAALAFRSKVPNLINKLKSVKLTPVQKLQKGANVTVGHNKILDETTKKFVETVDEMINLDKAGYDKMLEEIKALLKPCDASILPKDGIIYHGTSLKNAQKIVKEGVSPFVSSEHGRELGVAFYTTPNSKVADFFGTEFSGSCINGIVLPFKMNTDKVAYLDEKTVKSINSIIKEFYLKNADKTKYFKQQGISLPDFADSILAGFCPSKNVTFLRDVVGVLMHKAFSAAGFDAAYLGKAMTAKCEPLWGVSATKALEEGKGLLQSQFAIFDGTKIELMADKIRDAVKLV